MAIALLPETCAPIPTPIATMTRVIVCSPIRSAEGSLRVLRETFPAVGSLVGVIPAMLHSAQVSVNGGIVHGEDWASWELLPGDEVLIVPQWGTGLELGALLVYAAVGLVVSIATTALSYVLFPPPKAHNIQHTPEEPSFSFEGIRTTLGPGAVVPVIYGRKRTGGQLLQASVDQTLTVLDDGVSSRRITASAAPATLSLLLALGEGPIEDIQEDTIQINGQPIGNFPGVQVYMALGTDPQDPLPTFGETANSFADGRTMFDATPITYTTQTPIDAFVLNLAFLQGLYQFTSKGEKVDNEVRLQYRWKVHPDGPWLGEPSYEVVSNRTSVVRFGIRRENLALAVYDIEVQVTFVQRTDNAQYQPTLESVTEIQRNTQSYPGTALLGLRAVATDSLQGALPNVTVQVLGRKVRVDTFSSLPVWSDSPAWCTMDFLTNTRYGLGVPDSQIDLGSFVAWSDYCHQFIDGEQRHILNYALDRDVRAQQVLLEMAGSSRTLLFKSEGQWIARPTRDDAPVLLLSWANCTDLRLTYTRDPDRINVIEARYSNEEKEFEQDVLTWPTLENWPSEVRKASIEVRGITKPSRVMRAMQFELNRRRFENLSLEVTCSLEAVPLQPHDLFRFSHPLPGWGISGRCQEGSTTTVLRLDHEATFTGLHSYIVYVRHQDGSTEVKPVSYPGDVSTRTLTLLAPLNQAPVPRLSLWAFGYLVGPADTAVKLFRVVQMQRTSDNRVRIQAMIHNASIYDEPTAEALPVSTLLFNPLGPPPGLTSLIVTEVVRVQASGASMHVVNLSWDVEPLGPGFAPYGGALILRRLVFDSALAGLMGAGSGGFGQGQGSEPNVNYFPLMQVSGHIMDWDDYTALPGITYVYRVVPMSSRGVPNYAGAREVMIHIAGPTTPDFFPGSVARLRLKGRPVGELTFEGRDAQFEWDPMNGTGLFSETFFVVDYIVEIWAPGQLYLMRRTTVPAQGAGVTLEWTYTLEYNMEDQANNGYSGARRDFSIYVWARTNTGRVSLTPATITVSNPPPDMGDMVPAVQVLFGAAIISFDQFVEPRDFDHYEVHLDTMSPPQAIYEDLSTAFHGQGSAFRKITPQGLVAGTTYYVQIMPYDTFGPGIATHIASFVGVALDADSLDTIPPDMPTGLVLTTGSRVSDDGTIMSWVRAAWNTNLEHDMASYTIQFRVNDTTVPTTFTVAHPTSFVELPNVPGYTIVHARLLAADKFANYSAYTNEVFIVTAVDTVAPGVPTNLSTFGSFRAIVVRWTPPSDADYFATEVWISATNDLATAALAGEGSFDYVREGIGSEQTRFFWLRAKDTSGNMSAFVPGPTAGLSGTTVTTSNADIGNLSITETKIANNSISTPKLQANSVDANKVTTGELITLGAQIRNLIVNNGHISNLSASKITAGDIQALVRIGVANNIFLDGVNHNIAIYDSTAGTHLKVLIGKLGALSNQYGMQIFNEAGQVMWNFTDGAQTPGIADNAITATKITASTITSTHLRTDTAVITTAAQIANAIINFAHITSLNAEAIRAGKILVQLNVGVGTDNQLFIDGTNRAIYVYDEQTPQQLRVWIGRFGANYGVLINNAAGQTMWDFNSGASSLGIQDLAVTNAKIANAAITSAKIQDAAITNAKIGNLEVNNAKIANLTVGTGKIQNDAITTNLAYSSITTLAVTNSEGLAAALTFSQLDPGDQVILWASATGTAGAGTVVSIRIREDTVTGTELAYTALGQGLNGSLNTHTVFTHSGGGPFFNKVFIMTFASEGGDTTSVHHVKFTGLQRRR